ncbi:hypothetical protein E1B28_012035 [Marasmius oreades]|uniref:Ricin B lectin domain-containing protein n=1 Tax=Marasmius oreades TaxID=181124 RepID=A0A9P7RRN4_9AGAR|nr:uncharacterized protein E1B28_012035 [Marasmius oreades]KAG7087996.1 hypothetical protein E1B28_012035 [Marasmius oreades]
MKTFCCSAERLRRKLVPIQSERPEIWLYNLRAFLSRLPTCPESNTTYTMRSSAIISLGLSALATVSTASKLQNTNPAFLAEGRFGCITASSDADGAPVVVQDCDTDLTKQDWDFTGFNSQNSPPQPLKIFDDDKCLDVKDGINADGTKLQVWTCISGSTNQLWISVTDFTFQWAGTNKCIDLTDGNINNGNQLQLWTCDSNNWNQQWAPISVPKPPNPTTGVMVEAAGTLPHQANQCMAAAQNADGASVSLTTCANPMGTFPNGNWTWVLPAIGFTGQIKTFDGTKCLDATGGDSSNGNLLQIWSCSEGNTNQLWNVDGPEASRVISWAGQSKCVDVKDGNLASGNDLEIWDCDSSRKQGWQLLTPFV